MFEIGLSTNGKGFGRVLFEAYRAAGIRLMEISLSKEGCDRFDFKAAERLSSEYGVRLWSFHLPFMPFTQIDISSPLLFRKSVAYLSEFIKKGADIGIDKFILHPSGEPILLSRRARLEISKESLFSLAETARECGAVIAVEDLPRTCLGRDSAEMKELLSAHKGLRVCFDTNHLLKESLPDFIAAVGDKIITTHVSDYDFRDEKHWLPGEGLVDWRQTVDALEKAGYHGPWLYEVGFKAPASMPRSRELTCSDFVENAREIFENRPITVIR